MEHWIWCSATLNESEIISSCGSCRLRKCNPTQWIKIDIQTSKILEVVALQEMDPLLWSHFFWNVSLLERSVFGPHNVTLQFHSLATMSNCFAAWYSSWRQDRNKREWKTQENSGKNKLPFPVKLRYPHSLTAGWEKTNPHFILVGFVHDMISAYFFSPFSC